MGKSFTRAYNKPIQTQAGPFIGRLIVLPVYRIMLFLAGWFLAAVSLHAQSPAPAVYTSSGSWTCPPGVTRVRVECWGGGGGGGTRTSNGGGGGGGGSAYAASVINVTPGNTYSFTVGAGGSAGVDGGNTGFNSNQVLAQGGKGCPQNTTTGAVGGSTGGSIGSIIYSGGNGGTGAAGYGGGGGGGAGTGGNGTSASNQTGGTATANNGGFGANGTTSINSNGNNGALFGGGGSGARRTSSGTCTGGNGAGGRVVISPFIWANPITGTNPNVSNPYATGNITANNVTVSGISRGSGITGSNANDRYAATGWNTLSSIDLNDYFEFTLTPASGYAINFHSFVYVGELSSHSATHALRSSVSSFGTNIGTTSTSGSNGVITVAGGTISLTEAAYQTVTGPITFRFYTYGVNSSSRVYSINDFAFYGMVFPVPVISSFSPTSACAGSGQTVTITGQNFTGATGVEFNGVAASSFAVNSSTQITATLPAGATSGNISVLFPYATAISAGNFTVHPVPSLNSPLNPGPYCSNSTFQYTPTSDVSGATFTWTRAAVSGISNAAVTTPQSANPNEILVNTTSSDVNVVYAYTVSANGCSSSHSVTVTIKPAVTASGSLTPETYTSNGCWIGAPGVTKVMVEAWGGGGGGASRTTNGGGGGGGGGAYAAGLLDVTPGNIYTIMVGSGGDANTDGSSSGFGNLVLAEGGKGASENNTTGAAGGSVAASIGDTKYSGGFGANGTSSRGGGGGGGAGSWGNGGNSLNATGGSGANEGGGNGGNGPSLQNNGGNGVSYGGGGGGALRTSSNTRTGGSGAPGRVIVSPVIWANSITGTDPGQTTPFTSGDIKANNITVSGISRIGLNGSNGNDRYAATNWPISGINTGRYFEFTITPAAGYAINFHSFVYTGQVSTGSSSHSFRSSVGSYGSNIGSPTTAGASISLTGSAYQLVTGPVTFRFYTHNVSNQSTTVYSINDFVFYGTVFPVPVISSFSPSQACVGSGATVTITGNNLTHVSGVQFNGVNAASFTVNSATQITATLPAGATTGLISVVTPWATVNSSSNFTVHPIPSLTSLLNPGPYCSNSTFQYTPTSNVSGATFTWTRAAVSGISNAAVTTPQSVNPNEVLVNTTSSDMSVVYAYTVSANGCSSSQSVTVTVKPGASAPSSLSPETYTSNDCWTGPPGITKVMVETWGGGGGGASRTTNDGGGGGGGGAYAASLIDVTPGTSYTVLVGAGGGANSDGSSSSFNGNQVLADGGKGGTENSTTGAAGGSAAASTGDTKYSGGFGANGTTGGTARGGGGGGGAGSRGNGGNGSGGTGGSGANEGGGNGGNGPSLQNNGGNGVNYGGGGGGALRTSSGTRTGGSGAGGRVIVSPVIWTNPVTGTNPNTSNPYTTGNITANNVTVSGISRGSGITGSNANDRYAATGWSTSSIDLNDYFEFTLTPAPGYAINFHSFVYTGQVSTGSPSHTFRSSVTGTTNIGSPVTAGTTISLSASNFQVVTGPITFRLHTHNASSGAVYSINDFAFYGVVVPLPVISSFSPASACAGSGETVTLTGSNFIDVTAVRFNGINATSYTVNSSTQITATLPAGATTGAITLVTPGATATSGSNFTVNPQPSFPAPFTTSSASVCQGTQNVVYTVPANAGVTYNWSYSGTGVSFSSTTNTVSVNFAANATSGTLAVTASNGCGTSSARSMAVTVNTLPVATITPNYCTGTGYVRLTGGGGGTYLWSTGQSGSFIDVDQAGNYGLTVTNAAGCQAIQSIDVAQELVINGNFEAGNTGFTTAYTFNNSANGVWTEGYYAVNNNANYNHNLFYGKDHTTGNGNFMIINGHPSTGTTVWSQNNISVQPHTTYYFSAWGLSVHNTNRAVLQFSINGAQVGTVAYLPEGYTNTSGPYNWVRFYGSWNSGPSATADLSIINLNTVLGGNDFGLDDISFGTLAPVALSASPLPNSGNGVCIGGELYFTANAVGGASPFTYAWTGPNGFSSSLHNPTVTASASSIHNGTYQLTVTDGFGCQITTSYSLTVNPLPIDKTAAALASTICSGTGTSIQISNSEPGVYYQLRDDAGNTAIGNPVSGTGGTILLPTGNLEATTIFNVLAVSSSSGCSRQLSVKPTVNVTITPVLKITNQAACSGTVNLTSPAVTAGSTGGGTLSYWTNAAATTAMSTPTAAGNGTYYIKSDVSGCFDIEPVVVRISSTPATSFFYSGSPFCSTGNDPLPTFSGSAVAGAFSSTSGLVFISTATGQIDVSASNGGTYTVTNTIIPAGGCGTFSSTSNVVITKSPVASFEYNSNDLCQSANGNDPAPTFLNGGTAGTFSSSFGMALNASTGVIDISECLPGNYAVVNTIGATGGCAAVRDTVFIYINPYTFTGVLSASVSNDMICQDENTQLLASGTSYFSALLKENFNGTFNNWVTTNASTGGTPATAAWTLRPDNYNSDVAFRSNDQSQFYVSHSWNQNGATSAVTNTILRSPVMSTVGYSTLSLNFWHYYRFNSRPNEAARVEVSTDGNSWTTVSTYTSNQGSSNNFSEVTINLNAYVGQPVFYVRFRYYAEGRAKYWAIDNVTLAGMSTNYTYSWASTPTGLNSTQQNPVVAPSVNTFYILTATNTYGCSTPVSPVPVTVKPLPVLTSPLTPPAVCSNTGFEYTPVGSVSGSSFTWTRAAMTGISNAAITTPQSGNPNEVLVNSTAAPLNVEYAYSITAAGCSNNQTVSVTVNPKPVVALGTNIAVCNGAGATLSSNVTNAQSPLLYSWSPVTSLNNPTISNPVATPVTASESYTLTVTDGNGCVGISTPVTVKNTGFGGTPGLWTGAHNSDWNSCLNWGDGKVPTAATNIVINETAGGDCEITGVAVCNSLLLFSNGSNAPDLILSGGGSLAVTNNISIQKTAGANVSRLVVSGASQLSCKNLSLSGSGEGAGNAEFVFIDPVSSVFVNGDMLLETGGRMIMSDGVTTSPTPTLHVRGNFANNATVADFQGEHATIIFAGSSLQTISCPPEQAFSRLVINNTNPVAVRLNNSITVEESIAFTNGRLDLNGYTLNLGGATTNINLSGGNGDSYAIVWKNNADNGHIVHRVHNSGRVYRFPMGDADHYTPFSVELNAGNLTNATLTGNMRAIPHPQTSASSSYLHRYWIIEPQGITDPEYTVDYTFDNSDVTGDPASLFPAKFSGTWLSCSESSANWTMGSGNVNATTRTLHWSGLTTFSEFTGVGDGGPLPVELLSFTAEPENRKVLLTWITSAEINNAYFTVERSRDAVHFEEVGRVDGAGNSTTVRSYASTDDKPYNGVSYYRLKQTDYNGEFKYSNIVPVQLDKGEAVVLEDFMVQPDNGTISFRFTNPPDENVVITLFDASGKLVYTSTRLSAGRNWRGEIGVGNLSRGVYFAGFSLAGKRINRKFVY